MEKRDHVLIPYFSILIISEFVPNKTKQTTEYNLKILYKCTRSQQRTQFSTHIRGDSEEDLISFRDTHWNTTINLSEITFRFENTKPHNVVDPWSTLNNNGTAIISVQSYSCDENNKEKVQASYELGDPFSICVDLADADDHDNYFIEGFQYVTCETKEGTIYLVENFSPFDMLTTVDSEVDENGVRSVRSVVTSELGKHGEYAFLCEGQVAVSVKEGRLGQVQGQRRRSLAVTENKDEYSLRNRNVEYPPQESMSPFQIEIDLNSELNGPTSDKQDVNNPTFFFLNVVGLIVGLVVVAFIFYKAVIIVVAFIFYKTVIIAEQVEEEKVSTTTTATEVQADIEAAIK